jgi:prepilin-type N-terminal cleavage/methylation domain-containing protein
VAIGRRKGFTLVEVIVVLVILAILAAIAIPALTGYIDKAEDKKYIAQARNVNVAVRSVLDDAYADGSLFKYTPSYTSEPDFSTYPTKGDPRNTNTNVKSYWLSRVSSYSTPPGGTSMYARAAELIAINAPSSNSKSPGDWSIDLYAPADGSSVLDATAFIYHYWPDGAKYPVGSQYSDEIIVTYGIEGLASEYPYTRDFNTALNSIITYSPDAGYHVFHVKHVV